MITESPHVRAISFTGSTRRRQAHPATACPLTTRVQMELGGKNPLIVMEDADLDLAVDLAIKGGLSLSGQACTGTSRILVVKQVRDAFIEKLRRARQATQDRQRDHRRHGRRAAGDRQAARDRALATSTSASAKPRT